MARRTATAPCIVLVSHDASRTGAPAMALRVGGTLAGLGYRVRPVLRRGGPRSAQFQRLGRVRHELPGGVGVVGWSRSRWAVDRFEELLALLALLRTPGDVVWCNSVMSANYVRPALMLRRRVVLHSHEVGPVLTEQVRRYRSERWASRVSVVGCSEFAAASLASALGLEPSQVAIVRSAPEGRTIQHRAGGGDLVVGMCGPPVLAKGVDLFASVAWTLRDERVRWRWVGGERPPFIDREAAIEFVPELDDAVAEIAGFDLFLMPSRSEAAPLVLVEAMGAGVPVVALAVGGVPGVVGDAGVLVPAGDDAALVAEVAALLRDSARRASLADAGRARAAELTDPDAWRDAVRRVIEPLTNPPLDGSRMGR